MLNLLNEMFGFGEEYIKVEYLTDENYNQQVAAAYKKILPSKLSQTNAILAFLETLC